VHRKAEELDRDNVAWCHGYQPWVGVDLKSSKKAYDAVKKGMEGFYHIPFEKFERYTPSGTPAEVAEQLVPYIEAGCRLFNLKICAEHAEEEVALGAEVVAQLKRLAPTLAVPT
jgi:alkanesulfonate monooxygenase SsuD/methylene tetrahydromethanopterin reductase-like flavin-dependent oxidoreductase (luciferase family)